MSSSDSNVVDTAWARHYEEAAARRRARGWHRREERTSARARHAPTRVKVYALAAGLFVALTIVALLIPR
jgi:hypothetical protein